ncbi:MAG: DNA repair protein RecO [Candidatus Omnitrophica bacterium]|nr:DNA repair protein RecO [Candidatus Omnitrophota bacterium]
MPIYKTEAIVLNRREFRETSLIVDFFTRDFGKMTGIVKGVRAEPDKFASNFESFSCNEIIFYRKRSSFLHLIAQADKINNFDGLKQDIDKISLASCMLELIDATMAQEDKNEEVFSLLNTCLKELEVATYPEKIVTIFKIKILALSGFKPHFDSCVSCSTRILGESKFSLSLGGLLCPRCSKKDRTARSIFRGTVASILHIEKNDFSTNLKLGMNPQIRRELEAILNAFLNFHLGKELKSEKILRNLAITV